MSTRIKCVFATAVAAISSVATADIVHFNSDPSSTTNSAWTGASLIGSVEYTYTGDDEGTLVFSMTNTTDPAIGGFLTGFVFNFDSSDDDAEVELDSATNNKFRDTGRERADPFGTFDAGAALKGKWTGGGKPGDGIGVGITELFTFEVEADDAASLTAMSFLGDGTEIALRFKCLNDGASDKLLVSITNDPNVNVVPLPSGVLAGGAMLGLCLGVRRLRK